MCSERSLDQQPDVIVHGHPGVGGDGEGTEQVDAVRAPHFCPGTVSALQCHRGPAYPKVPQLSKNDHQEKPESTLGPF